MTTYTTPDQIRIRPSNNISPLRQRFVPPQSPTSSPSLGGSPHSPTSPMYQVKYKDYESAIRAVAQLESELNEFQQSSYELEKELEKELLALEDANQELQDKNDSLTKEIKHVQNARFEMEKEIQRSKDELLKKCQRLEQELEIKTSRLVDIEILNDSIEQSERNLDVSYKELEEKYHISQEKIVILEAEISDSKDELFKEQLNHQNTKNELEDLRVKYDQLLKSQSQTHPTTSNPESRPTSMSRSTSLRQLHSMIEHTKDMESKIDNIKLSLNKNQNLKIHRIKSATTTRVSTTHITTTTPAAITTPSQSKPPRRTIPQSPSSYKLSSFTSSKLNALDTIEGSPNIKSAHDTDNNTNKIFGGKLRS